MKIDSIYVILDTLANAIVDNLSTTDDEGRAEDQALLSRYVSGTLTDADHEALKVMLCNAVDDHRLIQQPTPHELLAL